MADLLQRLIVLFLLCGTALAAPFSHRTHLGLKLQCLSCHASASSSTKIEDNNLPQPAVCLGCHTGEQGKAAKLDGGPSIKTPRQVFLARFNHQQHLKLGNIASVIAAAIDSGAYLSRPGDIRRHLNTKDPCAACHRGLQESDAVTPAAFPQMADCLVCHSKVDPPFSCSTCHVESPKLKPASHDSNWFDFHGSGKANLDKPSCAVCHGRTFTCQGCH
ncbi:MAG: cytochrome c3 family protein [Bryobacteraceae bacterium]